MEISPTMACNVNCRFCRRQDELPDYYRHAKDLTDVRWYEIISEAVRMGTKRLFFRGGGDPGLKRSLLKRLFPLIKEQGLWCTLLTNGTLIDDAMADGFVRSGWQEIIISLHGGDAATHDSITDHPGSFAMVERSLDALNRRKDAARSDTPSLSFHVVLTRLSYRNLDKIIDLARARRCGHVSVFPMHNPPYAEHARDLEMTDNDRAQYRAMVPGYRQALDASGIGHDFQLSYQGEGGGEKLVDRVLSPRQDEGSGQDPVTRVPCYFPWYHAALTPNGFVSPCCNGEGKQSSGNLDRVDFREAWLGHDMREVRAAMLEGRMMSYCRTCPNWFQGDNARLRRILSRGLP
jgi:MoaA/NifB/PqqE/SkfB family radical SAM enzyme